MNDRIRPVGRTDLKDRRRVDYAHDLNEEQLAAVMHPGGPMLVLAGAGTGKTRTLVYRASRLIEDGVPPGQILLLTFTNKSAREMLDRVGNLLDRDAGRVHGGTFHSAGHRILRRYAKEVGYTQRFSILDREDAGDLMGHALADVSPEVPKRRLPRPRLLVNLYSFVINTGHELEEVLAERSPQFYDQAEIIAAIFKRYLERKRNADLMDFDDLLLNWLLLLKRYPDIRRRLAANYTHILVDEYQDTNRLQADIVDAMLGSDRNVMVVGDDAQSIYAFRGADFDNILSFPERHSGATVFRLETNYRSSPPILALANASIAHNERQFKKELRSIRKDGEMPAEVVVPGPEQQATWIADTVLELREEGIELEEMAVLYRNHSHSFDLQVELTRRNIPFEVRSGLRFFEHRHVKDVLAHLRFIDNPRDEISFARLMKLRSGFGPRLTARLWQAMAGANPLERFLHLDPSSVDLPKTARGTLASARTLLAELANPKILGQPGEGIRLVVTEFYKDWARGNLENSGNRLQDIEQLALFADGFPDMSAFLSEVTLLNDLSGEDSVGGPADEVLALSSTHQAKGLEWRVVFVIWLAEGRFPSARAEDMEEERRLFYVAVTRARDRLFLLRPELARDRYRVDVLLDPSRFVSEIPDDLRTRIVVAEEREEDQDLLPAGRYQLPGFLDDPKDGDDEVN